MKNNVFKELVKKVGSQKQFCLITGMNKDQCSRFFTGKRSPRIEDFLELSEKIGYTLDLVEVFKLESNVKK